MKRALVTPLIGSHILKLALVISMALPLPSLAATVSLAAEPLTKSTTGQVLPNLMFILDDSTSMEWDYLPDWADSSDNKLFKNADYNGVYYNPAVTYTPPVHYLSTGALDTTTYLSQTGQSSTTGADTSTKPNWKSVKNDAYGIQSTSSSDLTSSASYYTFIPGEYCTAQDLKTCVTSATKTTTHPYPAPLRWCSDTALTTCQALKTATYQYARYAGMPSTSTITVGSGTTLTSVSSITVNGKEILSAATSSSTSTTTVATRIRDAINACTTALTGNCTVAGYSATASGSTVTLKSPTTGGGPITGTPSITKSGNLSVTPAAFTGGTPGANLYTAIVSTTTSYPYPNTTTKHANRTDCTGTTCTYAEEMTNFANWWTYYHTRMQAMKTSVSRAFKSIDNRFRVGFSTISYTGTTDGSDFLHIDTFETTHKNSWFTKLLGTSPRSSSGGIQYTPLRGALSKAGRIYAHKITGAADPIQYSCQQNFTILSTDGYWNTEDETSTYGAFNLSGSNVGNLDGGTTARPMYEGTTAVSNSLADIAKYYYDTDLRTSALGNCPGGTRTDGTTGDVCEDNVFVSTTDNNAKQHMTTFTMGLGVSGLLNFTTDYETATSGDYYNLKNGLGSPTVNWPNPLTTSTSSSVTERIDDLWHAAVNGHGTYFSAKDPNSIIAGFNKALSSIKSKIGAGAAAATSTLNPVAGDNLAYVASYTTMKWQGNLEARTINVDTGEVSEDAKWCAENISATTCTTPSYLVQETVSSSTVYYCVTPSSSAATCGGTLVGTDCKVEVQSACIGTMASKVSASSDSRTIKMNVSGVLEDFTYAKITAAGLNANFDSAFLSANLSQWASLDATQQTAAAGTNLVNYLRGQYAYEDRSTNPAADRLYRLREAVLGDAVESKPAYVAKPTFSYTDPGYSTFLTTQASRAGTVYIGTNDGMLHAFDGSNGNERWAYVPSMVIPNMWKLADKNYSTMHTNYVNGGPVISDICSANCTDAATAVWKTILVGGLNGGGRGYYALDITNPTSPALLWEFTTTDDNDLGYSFGNPIITKKSDGTWVVLITSGYNNTTGTNPGKGILYVLNPMTGAKLSKYTTTAGDATTPSGLAKINAWADDAEKNNTATYTYGGDLLGNVWRFDINAAASTSNPLKFATLFSDTSGTIPQPITVRPELGLIDGKRVVFVGTGKYLETGDLEADSSVDRDTTAGKFQKQTLYGIKDDNATSTLVNPRATLIAQTITTPVAAPSTRTVSSNEVNFVTGNGWYVDFPDNGERQNVDAVLIQGTLIVPTTVPTNSVCAPGGYSWLNFFNYKTGGAIDSSALVSTKANAPIVGTNIFFIGGKPKVSIVTADKPTPDLIPGVPFLTEGAGFQKKRVIWRELID